MGPFFFLFIARKLLTETKEPKKGIKDNYLVCFPLKTCNDI